MLSEIKKTLTSRHFWRGVAAAMGTSPFVGMGQGPLYTPRKRRDVSMAAAWRNVGRHMANAAAQIGMPHPPDKKPENGKVPPASADL